MSAPFTSIVWKDSTLVLLDQRHLPHREVYLECVTDKDVFDAIVTMAVRGAPAIGVAAAFGVVLAAYDAEDSDSLFDVAQKSISYLATSRPTAVNLFWALKKMQACVDTHKAQKSPSQEFLAALEASAVEIYNDDIETNISIARHGLSLVPDGATIIHHCNTGSLATVAYGTALGVIRYAHEQGKKIHVYLDETRPRFQGASLSAFELQSFGVPHTVMVDSASGFLMKTKKVDLCIVGCDRVAANGDTANKIGTYNLALAAKAHGVPFYVACPTSTIDFSIADGNEIEIEERAPEEITEWMGQKIAPSGTKVFNPAFDVTPAELIAGFVTEKGVFKSIEAVK